MSVPKLNRVTPAMPETLACNNSPIATDRDLPDARAVTTITLRERDVLPPEDNARGVGSQPAAEIALRKPAYLCAAATLVYLLAAACRLLAIRTVPTQDAASYLYQAMHLEYYLRADNTTNGLAYHGPGFPLAIRALLPFTHNPLTAAKIVIFGLAVGYLAVGWRLLHVWFQPTVARVAYLLGLSMLPLFETINSVMSDVGGAFFALAGVLLLETGRKTETAENEKRLWWGFPMIVFFGIGFLLGTSYLFRYMYKLVPLCIVAGWMLFDAAPMPQKGRRIFALLGGFGIVFIGWAMLCHWGRGISFPDRNHAAIVWQALDKTNSWIQFQDYADKYPTIGDVFRHQGKAVFRNWAKTVYHAPTDFWLQTFTFSSLLLPLGLAVYMRYLNLARLQFLLIGAALLLVTGFFWFEVRTLLPLMFWLWGLCSLAAHSDLIPVRFSGLYAEGGWLWRRVAAAPLRKTVLGLMFLTLLVPWIFAKPWRYQASPLDRAAEQAGIALHAIATRQQTLSASVYSIGLYADVHTIGLHEALPHDPNFADTLQLSLLSKRADYLAYIEGQSRYEYPELQFLLNPRDPRVPENFELVYQSTSHPAIVIYRLHTRAWAEERFHPRLHVKAINDLDDGLGIP